MSEKILKGKVHKLGDDINTDYIISGRYKFKTLDPNELARHLLEDICPDFYQKISPGDFIVAGENFGCGSSREQAPPIIITDTDEINQDDTLLIDLKKGAITVCNREKTLSITPFPSEILSIIEAGGLVEYFKKYGGWRI